jgi:hypothetical protein
MIGETDTVTVVVDNDGDRLTQEEWSEYVVRIHAAIEEVSQATHFGGASNPVSRFQNFCWVFKASDGGKAMLKAKLQEIRGRSGREPSVAVVVGETIFV